MLSRIHDKLGTVGLIVAVVALVAALAGTAFAAAGLNSKQKKEVKKIAKKFAGKPGPAGPAGAPGSQGPKGDTGAAGKDGTNGSNGADGKSVVVESVATGTGSCSGLGGAKFHQEGSTSNTFACNGQSGFTKTLPEGETETGVWSFFPVGGHAFQFGESVFYSEGELTMLPLSFNIPLAEKPEALVYNSPESSDCPGTLDEPKAAPGKLCVYATGETYDETTNPKGTRHFEGLDQLFKTGGILAMQSQEKGKAVWGTWAVTPKAP